MKNFFNKKKIKVCFISLRAYSLFNKASNSIDYGGAEVQMYQIARKLATDNSLKISFIVGDYFQAGSEDLENVSVIRSRRFDRKFNILSAIVEQIYFLLTLRKTRAEVYVQRAIGLNTFAVAIFSKLFRKKFIYMTANLPDVDRSYRKKNPIKGWLFEKGLGMADAIIAQNKQHQEKLMENFGIKSVVIKNSFTISQEGVSKVRKFVLWVSNSRPQKNPEIFLNLSRKFPKEKFVMIMPQNDEKLWNKTFLEAKSIKNLEFINGIPFERIDRYFKEAKVFVNTSTYEGFPNTFIQSTMFGVPILSYIVNPDNFIVKYKCGFACKGDYGKMEKQMYKLLNDKNLWGRCSKNTRSYVEMNHNINKNIEKIKKVICNLMKIP